MTTPKDTVPNLHQVPKNTLFKNMYWSWEGVLSSDFCDLVLKDLDWDNAEDGKIRTSMKRDDPKAMNPIKRITKVLWQDFTTPIAAVAYHYTLMANKAADWNFNIEQPQAVQLGRYNVGGHYSWHCDCGVPDENNFQRKLSCTILLNDFSEYDGGLLEFIDLPEESQPPTTKGSIIIFPSILVHRVTPVTRGERFSAVCWSLGPPFK